jgi:hypothetical protein
MRGDRVEPVLDELLVIGPRPDFGLGDFLRTQRRVHALDVVPGHALAGEVAPVVPKLLAGIVRAARWRKPRVGLSRLWCRFGSWRGLARRRLGGLRWLLASRVEVETRLCLRLDRLRLRGRRWLRAPIDSGRREHIELVAQIALLEHALLLEKLAHAGVIRLRQVDALPAEKVVQIVERGAQVEQVLVLRVRPICALAGDFAIERREEFALRRALTDVARFLGELRGVI